MEEEGTGPQVNPEGSPSPILSLGLGSEKFLTRRMGAGMVEEALGKGKRKADPSGLSLDDGRNEKRRQPCRTPSNVPTPQSVDPLVRAPTWLGRELALSWGSGGGERLLSPTPGWTGALYRGGQGDLQPRELSSINLSVPLT